MLARLYARIDIDLLRRVDKARGDMDRTQFIVEALKEKLARKIKEDKSYEEINQFMNEMVALNPKRNIRDLQIKSDFIFEELKKQNEVLKKLLRRSITNLNLVGEKFARDYGEEDLDGFVRSSNEQTLRELKTINLEGNKHE